MDENRKDNTNVEETKKDYERYCSLCRRPERVAGQLIEIPGGAGSIVSIVLLTASCVSGGKP